MDEQTASTAASSLMTEGTSLFRGFMAAMDASQNRGATLLSWQPMLKVWAMKARAFVAAAPNSPNAGLIADAASEAEDIADQSVNHIDSLMQRAVGFDLSGVGKLAESASSGVALGLGGVALIVVGIVILAVIVK